MLLYVWCSANARFFSLCSFKPIVSALLRDQHTDSACLVAQPPASSKALGPQVRLAVLPRSSFSTENIVMPYGMQDLTVLTSGSWMRRATEIVFKLYFAFLIKRESAGAVCFSWKRVLISCKWL